MEIIIIFIIIKAHIEPYERAAYSDTIIINNNNSN